MVSLTAATNTPPAVRYASCTISGDPHYKTFDGVYHDFQGRGTFVAVENNNVAVQFETSPCNGGSVTCMKRTIISVRDPFDVYHYSRVEYANWPGSPSVNITIDDRAYTPAQLTTNVYTGNQLAVVMYNQTQGHLIITGRTAPYIVRIGLYYISVSLPYNYGFFGDTKGLCGTFNSVCDDDFTGADGKKYETGVLNTRINNDKVNQWGATFGVTATSVIRPIVNNHLRFNPETNQHELFEGLPAVEIPTSAEQEELAKVPFESLEKFNSAQAHCKAISVASTDREYENCLYDSAIINDPVLSSSNEAAAQAAVISEQSGDSSGSSAPGTGAAIGIAFGCIAAVALGAAIVMYVRLRKVSAAYSRALIVRSQVHDANDRARGSLANNL